MDFEPGVIGAATLTGRLASSSARKILWAKSRARVITGPWATHYTRAGH